MGFEYNDLFKLSETRLTDYVKARLQGGLFEGKSVEPIVNSYLDEIPEDFLEDAYEYNNKSFNKKLEKVVEDLLFSGYINSSPHDEGNRHYTSRLIYMAEVFNLKSALPVVYGFVYRTEYMGKSGVHTPDIYTQFLRALAQFQPPFDLLEFWVWRFYDKECIEYSQPLFTGLRRSSPEKAASTLPRLFDIAKENPKIIDLNRTLRPLLDYCKKDNTVAKMVARGFSGLSQDAQKSVKNSITTLNENVRELNRYL